MAATRPGGNLIANQHEAARATGDNETTGCSPARSRGHGPLLQWRP
jgi:hypothetical protein